MCTNKYKYKTRFQSSVLVVASLPLKNIRTVMMENLSANVNTSHHSCPLTIEIDFSNSTSFPESAISTWIGLSVFNGVAAVPTFGINLLVIWTILESETLRSVNYNLLLAILSLTDLLVGLLINPLFIVLIILVTNGCPSACDLFVVYGVTGILCFQCSLGTLMIASVERYLSIEYPLYYNTTVSTKKLQSAVAVTWALAVGTIVLRLTLDDFYQMKQVPMALYFGISVTVVFFCVAKVSKTAHRQMKAINAQQVVIQGPNTTADKIKEYKRTFVLAFLVLITIIFYCPFVVVKFVSFAKGHEWSESSFKYVIPPIVAFFIHLQSLVNPVFSSLRLSYIRAGVVKKLSCRF